MSGNSLATMDMPSFARLLFESTTSRKLSFSFFLGAGCSVSSGVLPGSTLCLQWIRELARKANKPSLDFERWYAETHDGFSKENAGQFYAIAMKELFPTVALRRVEVQRFVSNKDPGFGYATLGAIVNHETVGSLLNVVLTTNFDDLLHNALVLFYRVTPLVIAHDDLAKYAVPDVSRPLIIKLHGDALIGFPRNTSDEIAMLPNSITSTLSRLFERRGLIFMGYSGNDQSVTDAMVNLPEESLPNGVFWIGKNLPGNFELKTWLERRNAIWIKHSDFDAAMLTLLNEFKLERPNPKRFAILQDSYEATYAALLRRSAPNARRHANDGNVDVEAVVAAVRRVPTSDTRQRSQIIDDAILKYPGNAGLIGFRAQHLRKIGDIEAARTQFEAALKLDPDNVLILCHYASLIVDHSGELIAPPNQLDEAEKLLRRAVISNPYDPLALGSYASFLWTRRKEKEGANTLYQRALQADFTNSETLSSYANFAWRALGDKEEAIEYYQRSLDINPANFRTLANFSQLLFLSEDAGRAQRFAKSVISKASSRVLVLEATFYLLAHDKAQKWPEYLANIRALIDAGVRSPDWDLSPTVEYAANRGHRLSHLLQALSEVIGGASPERLDQFGDWPRPMAG